MTVPPTEVLSRTCYQTSAQYTITLRGTLQDLDDKYLICNLCTAEMVLSVAKSYRDLMIDNPNKPLPSASIQGGAADLNLFGFCPSLLNMCVCKAKVVQRCARSLLHLEIISKCTTFFCTSWKIGPTYHLQNFTHRKYRSPALIAN